MAGEPATSGWNAAQERNWCADCMKWRGRVLTGKFRHWCFEWDGLPVDETTPEWECGCFHEPLAAVPADGRRQRG